VAEREDRLGYAALAKRGACTITSERGVGSRNIQGDDDAESGDGKMYRKSSRTLRQWADEYCASDKIFKEFTFEKVMYGWKMSALTAAIRESVVKSHTFSGHTSTVTVTFTTSRSKIHIRPDTHLSRILSNKWLVVLLWVLMIYPFIWLFRRYHPRGGGRWEISGTAFPLKGWRHLDDSVAGESAEEYRARRAKILQDRGIASEVEGERVLKKTERGVSCLVGMREGEWFRRWEETIEHCSRSKMISQTPLTRPFRSVAHRLDGYTVASSSSGSGSSTSPAFPSAQLQALSL